MTEPFTGADSDEPRNSFPSVSPKNTGDTGTLNFDAIAPKQFSPVNGKDSYTNLPGDGITPA